MEVLLKQYHTYTEALTDLTNQGIIHLGWLNAGIKVPEGDYTTVFKNYSGSSTLMCDTKQKISFSIDMGD